MATKDISVIRDKKTGDIKNIRDKGIKDAKAKTAVAQTDAVRMKTVDNKEVYIDRNSLVQAIAEVMNSNSQSTIQTLFGADANGNHANINMANLASVLSAVDKFLTINNDMDAAGYYVGRSAGGAGEYLTLCYNGYGGQIVLSHNEGAMKFRIYYNYSWGAWKTISAT